MSTTKLISVRTFYQKRVVEIEPDQRSIQSITGYRNIGDFFTDLQDHSATEEIVLLLFTEFGRRVRDNGSGTDHGSGGGAFLIGDSVKGGLYGDYPSLRPQDLLEGDLQFNNDFRSLYSSILQQWIGLDPKPIVGGEFEQMALFR